MKAVIVTQGVEYVQNRDETRDFIDQRLNQFIFAADLTPVPIPNFSKAKASLNSKLNFDIFEWISRISPVGLILSGGNDIGTQVERDHTERKCLDFAKKTKIPVLGICRGMQMLAVYGGGSLVKAENQYCRHSLSAPNHEVNSYHSWAIRDCPMNFKITATCPNGNIEGIRHKDFPWHGWMWHPERETAFNPIDVENVERIFCDDQNI